MSSENACMEDKSLLETESAKECLPALELSSFKGLRGEEWPSEIKFESLYPSVPRVFLDEEGQDGKVGNEGFPSKTEDGCEGTPTRGLLAEAEVTSERWALIRNNLSVIENPNRVN